MIRIAEARDAGRMSEIFSPYVTDTPVSFATVPPTPLEFAAKIGEVVPDFPFLVLENEGRVDAYAYASKHRTLASYRWCCEVSIYVDSRLHRRGGASRLYTAMLPILRLQGIHHAYAGITLPNDASVAFHERFGFRYFATFESIGFKCGEWRDVGWWELRLQSVFANPPVEPRSFAVVQNQESVRVLRLLSEA